MSVSKSMKDQHGEIRSAVSSDGAFIGSAPRGEGNDQPDSPSATQVARRDSGPSPSIHEDMISQYNVKNPATGEPVYDPVLEKMESAVKGARAAAERAGRLAAAIHANEMATIPARHRQAKTETWRLVDPAVRALQSARENTQQALETLEEKTAAPPKPKDTLAYMAANEIRAVLRGMPEAERETALGKALAEDDDIVLAAVICSPSMLSGLSMARQQALRGAWAAKRHGPDLDRIARLQKALVALDRAGQLTIQYASRLSDSKIIDRAEALEAAVTNALKS